MANNRLRLRCKACGAQFEVAKFYPSTGWQVQVGEFAGRMNDWFDQHLWCGADPMSPDPDFVPEKPDAEGRWYDIAYE